MRSDSFLYIGIALVCVVFILVGIWYVGLEEPTETELTLTISMEKQTFMEGDSINISFQIVHNQESAVNVTQFWPGITINVNLFNSSGGQLSMRQTLNAIDLTEGVPVNPGVPYAQTMNIASYFDPLAPDQYTVNVTYINFHTDNGRMAQNGTYYFSDTLTFTIGEPPLPGLVSFALAGNETVEFHCEIADSAAEQALGLMYREELPADEGMLFVFDSVSTKSFWMKNTLIPLDMIFIDENGVVTNVEEADVETGVPDSQLTHYFSDGPVKYVLEINQGLAAANGIDAGTVATITHQN